MALNPAPNEFVSTDRTPHPAFCVSAAAQSCVLTSVPAMPSASAFVEGSAQPGFVCSVTWLFVYVFTPSTMSISPPLGQFGPFDQNAGHVPHPVGMCTASRTTMPCVYEKSVVIRTLFRAPETTGVVSTFMYALPALLMPVRFAVPCTPEVSMRAKYVAETSNGTHSSATINVIHSATSGVGFCEEGPTSKERVSLLRMTALVSRTRRFEKVALT